MTAFIHFNQPADGWGSCQRNPSSPQWQRYRPGAGIAPTEANIFSKLPPILLLWYFTYTTKYTKPNERTYDSFDISHTSIARTVAYRFVRDRLLFELFVVTQSVLFVVHNLHTAGYHPQLEMRHEKSAEVTALPAIIDV